ncbi:MAG TPA: hybrid sensor histidine kinase/response regulator [Caldimonas sp.]|jgi:CheY-like chemotaxis protein|nr:hybrid sensor histidine kinase/response regulator [Caldimonas sp.]HEX2541062.1 hybrid sensor histidine kinase/response regulator [Caldimonas sp.]
MQERLPSFTDTGQAAQAIERAIDPLRPLAEDKGVAILASQAAGGDGRFDLDVTRLERVVSGLIGDAINAAPAESRIEVESSWQAGGFQLRISDERDQEGPGVGLAIAQRIVDTFGGTIARGPGSGGRGFTVTVRLPPLAAPAAGAAPDGAAADATRLDGLRVLYIDDEADIAEAVGLTLESMGAIARTCTTFDDASYLLSSENYDVVVTDLSLGGGSTGYDVIELLRVLPQHRLVPAMVLSAYDGEDDLGATRDAGFVAHIVKPIDFALLAREMQSAVRRARAQGSR